MDPKRTRKAQKGDAQRQHTKAPVSGGDAPTRQGSPRALSGGGGGGKSATSPHTHSEAMERVERKANSVLFTPPNTSTPRGRSQERETAPLHRERTPVAAKKSEEPKETTHQRRRSETSSREPSPRPPTPPARARSPSPSSFLNDLFATLPDDDEEEPARGNSPVRTNDSNLLKEWSRIPKNFHLPTFESRRDDVLDFLEAIEHTFDVWGIQEDRARIKFMWAQCRDTTSRVWFKEHMESFGTYDSFCKEFVRRFASHTARRDALKSLRDIRQTGDPRGFVTAFERVMENLTRFGLHIDEEELIIFIQLAVNDSVRDGLDWSRYRTAHEALTKIASLSSARPRDDSHHSSRSRDETQHSRDTPARKIHAPETKRAPHKDRHEDRRPSGTFQRDGDRRCFSCGSDQHLRADCPQQGSASVPFNKGNGHHQGNGPRPRRF
jgi:hypothetical protein